MRSNLCMAGIGEVLMDVFEDGQTTLGGAPLNVVFHLNQLLGALSGGEAYLFSAVGDDAPGREIRSAVTGAGIQTRYLREVNRPTGTALVFESDGGAGFEIEPDVAWDYIEVDDAAAELARRCDAVVFGSLAQRSPVSRASIRRFVSQVEGHRLYDVNLRRNTRSGTAGYSAEILFDSLKLATLVKMNDTELAEVCSMLGKDAKPHGHEVQTPFSDMEMLSSMEWLAREFSLDAVAITRGAKGALLFSAGQHLQLADSEVPPALVHPVGAGDSFAAGLLFGTIQGWLPAESLELADLISSYVVRQVSATPSLPDDILTTVRSLSARADAAVRLERSR